MPNVAIAQALERPKKRRRVEKSPLERMAEEYEFQAAELGLQLFEPELGGQANTLGYNNSNIVLSNNGMGSSGAPFGINPASLVRSSQAAAGMDAYLPPNPGPNDSMMLYPPVAHQSQNNASGIYPQLHGEMASSTKSTADVLSRTHQSPDVWDYGYQVRNSAEYLPMDFANQGVTTAPSGSTPTFEEPHDYAGCTAEAPRAQTGNAAPSAPSVAAPTLAANDNSQETVPDDEFDLDYWIEQQWKEGEESNDSEDES